MQEGAVLYYIFMSVWDQRLFPTPDILLLCAARAKDATLRWEEKVIRLFGREMYKEDGSVWISHVALLWPDLEWVRDSEAHKTDDDQCFCGNVVSPYSHSRGKSYSISHKPKGPSTPGTNSSPNSFRNQKFVCLVFFLDKFTPYSFGISGRIRFVSGVDGSLHLRKLFSSLDFFLRKCHVISELVWK